MIRKIYKEYKKNLYSKKELYYREQVTIISRVIQPQHQSEPASILHVQGLSSAVLMMSLLEIIPITLPSTIIGTLLNRLCPIIIAILST